MQDEAVIFGDNFADLPLGPIGGDYSPASACHVLPALAGTGRWRETALDPDFASRGGPNWQIILENDGRHVLEQTRRAGSALPLLAAGEPVWREVTVEAGLRPLSESGWRAVIFRYVHARRFYALAFENGAARVIRRDLETETVLGEAPCVLDCDRYSKIKIVCRLNTICVTVDDNLLLHCSDSSAQAFSNGCVACAANHITRFASLRASVPRGVFTALQEEQHREAGAVRSLRARHPRPLLWKRLRTPQWGTGRALRAGDLNGDGRAELVLARRTDRLGGGSASSITSLAACTLDGDLLWALGEPGCTPGWSGSDLCFQVHDLNGDGKAEVFFCRDFDLFVADGATGKLLQKITLPKPEKQGGGEGLHRVFGDSLCFADLTGSGRADCVIVKDRQASAWAYDRDFNLLWHCSGILGRFPFVRDIDGDGKDEVLLGGTLLDHDGKLLWSAPVRAPANAAAFVDFPAGMRAVVAGSGGFHLLDREGRIVAQHALGQAQSLCVANLRPERDGLEVLCNTSGGAAALFGEDGQMLHEFEPMPYACLLQPVNWAPLNEGLRPADLVLLSTHLRQGGLMDGHGRRAVVFPDDNHPVLCSDARDLDGDGIDEVLTWDEHEIWIYKPDRVPGRDTGNYPRRAPWWNDSNFQARVSLPGK